MQTRAKRSFGKPKCCECGLELETQAAHYESKQRLYCAKCQPIAEVKQNWRPMGSGVVSRMFVIQSPKKKNTVL